MAKKREIYRVQIIPLELENKEDIDLLKEVAFGQKRTYNHITDSISGIKNYLLIKDGNRTNVHRKVIAEMEYIRSINFEYKSVMINKAVGNIKSNWSQTLKKVRSAVRNNEGLTKEDRRYIFTILKIPEFLHIVLNRKGTIDYKGNKYLAKYNGIVNTKKLNNLIRRYVRRYKVKIPKIRNSNNVYLTKNNYGLLASDETNKVIKITTTRANRGNRITAKMKTKFNKDKRSIQIRILENDKLEILAPFTQRVRSYSQNEAVLGLDLGMRDILSLSNGNTYGMNSTQYFYTYSDEMKRPNKSRLWSKYYNELYNGNYEKAEHILNNNLSNKQHKEQLRRRKEHCKSIVNKAIRDMVKNEGLKEIIREDLSWKSDKNKIFSGRQRNRFNTWLKGYIIERLEAYCEKNTIKVTIVNPAYTSQICHICKKFGKRKNETFTCEEHGEMNADSNASINICDRKNESNITLNSKPEYVKAYYEKLAQK